MAPSNNLIDMMFGEGSMLKAGFDYMVDTTERSTLFMDTLRKRGNNYHEHIEKGQPPVLVFDYDIIIDGTSKSRLIMHLLRLLIKGRRTGGLLPEMKKERWRIQKRPALILRKGLLL